MEENMPKKISRRSLLAGGIASTGMFLGADRTGSGRAKYPDDKGPGREAFWGPGPNKNLMRDLTPGTTPVRLAGRLAYKEDDRFAQNQFWRFPQRGHVKGVAILGGIALAVYLDSSDVHWCSPVLPGQGARWQTRSS